MALKTSYEWDLETVDKNGDIQDHHHSGTCFDLVKYPMEENQRLVLVRDRYSDDEGLQDRQWAYVENNKLPVEFDGGFKVPQRFHKELAKNL
jgi:hypothetical protein